MSSEEIGKIEDEGPLDPRPFVDRYYLKKYVLSPTLEGGDYRLLIHSNKLSLVTLAPSHPIITQNLTILSVNFKVSPELDRDRNVVSGKGKRGAQLLSPQSIICVIDTSCGRTFVVRAGLTSKLLEVNEKIRREPEVLKKEGLGYIAVLSPKASEFQKQLNVLLSEEDYQKKIGERMSCPP